MMPRWSWREGEALKLGVGSFWSEPSAIFGCGFLPSPLYRSKTPPPASAHSSKACAARSGPRLDLEKEPRLSDAGLTAHESDAAFASRCSLQALAERCDFTFAPPKGLRPPSPGRDSAPAGVSMGTSPSAAGTPEARPTIGSRATTVYGRIARVHGADRPEQGSG